MRARIAFLSVTALLVLAIATPSLALISAWARADAGEASSSAASTYRLDASARSVTVGAEANADWKPAQTVRAPAWSGMVTHVLVAPGDVVVGGDAITRINGIEIRYFRLKSPLHSPVCQGDTGQTQAVRAVLMSAGFTVGDSLQVSGVDRAAIREYAAMIDVPEARHVECFDPGWVITSSDKVGKVAEVGLTVGAVAPMQGEPVLVGEPVLSALSLAGDTGAAMIDEWLTEADRSTFAGAELLIGGRATGIELTDVNTRESRTHLASFLRSSGAAGAPTETEGTELAANMKIAVVLGLREAQYVVPATAVVSPSGPQACVVESGTGQVVPVTVVASSISGLVIDAGTERLRGPIHISPGDATCAS